MAFDLNFHKFCERKKKKLTGYYAVYYGVIVCTYNRGNFGEQIFSFIFPLNSRLLEYMMSYHFDKLYLPL